MSRAKILVTIAVVTLGHGWFSGMVVMIFMGKHYAMAGCVGGIVAGLVGAVVAMGTRTEMWKKAPWLGESEIELPGGAIVCEECKRVVHEGDCDVHRHAEECSKK